jgi:protein gp37
LVFTCSWSDWFHEGADAWREEAWDIIRRTPHLTYQILTKRPERMRQHLPADWGNGYPNVWLGVSVENQRWTTRIPWLLKVPSVVHFLSCEPLLGPLDLLTVENPHDPYAHCLSAGFDGERLLPRVDWVIAGGESGADARPMELDWARSLRDQCQTAGVPYFLKQLGGHPDARAHEKALLDGRTHTEMPSPSRQP